MSPRLRRQAKSWLLRLQAENVSAATRAEFEAWIAADPRHGAAFSQVCDEAAVGVAGAAEPAPLTPISRRSAALATAIIVLGAFGAAGLALYLRTPAARYETVRGQSRELALSEGSRIALNTDSSIEVRLGAHKRALRLRRGEALFEVAHDLNRPFEVEAGQVKVRALGTAFAVRIWDKHIEVMVIEGAVRVTRGAGVCELVTGERLRWGEASISLSRFDADAGARMLAWRAGMLHFEGEPLHVVAREVARYTGARIVIADAELGDLGVVAYIRADNLAGFIEALKRNFPHVEVVREDQTLLIRTRAESR